MVPLSDAASRPAADGRLSPDRSWDDGVRLLLANPLATIETSPGQIIVRTGWGGADGIPSDGTEIRIDLWEGQAAKVRLARSATTSDELYYTVSDSGGITICDHFRNALVSLPSTARPASPGGVCDHFLFRTTPGTSTYVDGIRRAGQGRTLTWQSRSGISESAATGPRLPEALDLTAAAASLDVVLEAEFSRMQVGAGAVNLLSGGIDSSLLQTYLPHGSQSVSAAIDSAEFSFERTYALDASRLLGTSHEVRVVSEADYLNRLQACIRELGTPPHHLQTVLLDAAFQSHHSGYVTAQFADALFGLDAARRAEAAWRWRALLDLGPPPPLLPARLRRAWQARRDTLRALRKPLRDLDSFANRFAVFAELPAVLEMFGPDTVQERFAARWSYVAERVPVDSLRVDVAGQLEGGHWLDFFSDNTVSVWRQLALSRGKSLRAPFSHRAVVEAAASVPSPDRFVHSGMTKPVLRELLARRLPAYPMGRPKGGSGLPFGRYYREGPLAGALAKYERPDFIAERQWRTLLVEPSWTAWNALTYVMWRDEVLNDASLGLLPGTRELTLPGTARH